MMPPMAQFHIMAVAVNKHHRMYDELIAIVRQSLIDLGHGCTVAQNYFHTNAHNVLIGGSIFAARHLELAEVLRGKPYILYQIEALDDARGLLKDWPEYRELMSHAACIWDYGPASTAYLRRSGFPRVSYLPPGYHPCLETFERAAPEVDFVFCGSPHPRRLALVTALRERGLTVALNPDVYGKARNQLIARARIALNIHAWDDIDALETVRLSLLLANRRFVISERGDHDPYQGGVVYADYDSMVEVCLAWLARTDAERDAIALNGYKALRQIDMIERLSGALPEALDALAAHRRSD